MSPIVSEPPPPSPPSSLESLVLDGLALNDGVTFTLESLEMPPPPKLWEWVRGADSHGAVLARPPLHELREITARVRIEPQASMSGALLHLGALLLKLQEAEQNQAGITLTWTPADSGRTLTAYVLGGEITGLPVTTQGDDAGWFVRAPVVTIRLWCDPFLYGAEVVGAPVTSTLPLMTVEVANVAGDVAALGRLIVTDNAAKARRLMRWGLESRWYPTSSPPALLIDSASLVTAGFAGTVTTRTGAYEASGIIRLGTGLTVPQAVCGLGNLTHIGTFRVLARVQTDANDIGTVWLRLAWRDGDGPLSPNQWVTPPVRGAFAEVDLGTVTITEKTLGTQRWTGQIECETTSVITGAILDVDYLDLIPAGEGYGVARGTYVWQPGSVVAHDQFTAMAATTALNARAAPAGGTWATSGATTDLTAQDGPSGEETMGRATVADTGTGRHAVLGATSYTDVAVGARVYALLAPTIGQQLGVLARYVDASNHLRLHVTGEATGYYTNVVLDKVVAGAIIPMTSVRIAKISNSTWYWITLTVFTSGRAIGTLQTDGGAVLAHVEMSDAVLATAGALATGKPGLRDMSTTATLTRYYDDFWVAQPPAEPLAINASQSLEIRPEGAIREDSTGVYWGPPAEYRGAGFYVPPAGTRNRKTRVAVKARRNDTVVAADDEISDSLTAQINHTPRYVVAPR